MSTSNVTRDRGRAYAVSSDALSSNKVIKNTYLLLAMTLLFSAFTAYLSYLHQLQPNFIVMLAGFIGLPILVLKNRESAWGLFWIFAFTGFAGYILGPILNAYTHTFSNGSQIITTAMGATAVIFFTLSGYALATRKDFSYMGSFLFTALMVVVLASIAGIFFNAPALQLAISCATALIFSGYILFDTSRIINGGERNYISAAISLYLDIFNLFLSLLRILALFTGRRD
jgi:modulator of FtsH protease